jgi:eukaryotic-like serine/threonine-protein kinase
MLTDDGQGELVGVPNLIGLTELEAEQKLDGAGLIVGDKSTRRTDRVPPGQVVDQDPVAGNQIQAGKAVNLVISAAPKPVEVPPLEGLTVDEARTDLEAAKLILGEVSEENSETIPEGRIISQSPGAGEEVPKDTPVDVVVSAGRSVVIVPDVTCLTYPQAKAQLQGLHLEAQLAERVLPRPECLNPQLVAQQDTAPGTQVQPGTLIVLHLGLPPSPSPSSSPSASPSP